MPKIIKVAKGSYTATDITVDSSGRVITASSGSGATNMALTTVTNGPASGTFTATPNTSKINVFIRGGGGAGGQDQSQGGQSGSGGLGGFGLFSVPTTQPYGVPYALGAGGAVGGPNDPGGSGSASTFSDNLTANGGGGGSRSPPTPASPGTPGNAPGGVEDYAQPTNDLMAKYYKTSPIGSSSANVGGPALQEAGGGGSKAAVGTAGGMAIYEDIG